MRDRLRVAETEMLENRAWRAEFERKKNGNAEKNASAAIAELQAREEDQRLRQESEDNRARRLAEAMTEQSMRIEQMRQVQTKLEDQLASRIGVLENSVQQNESRTSNLIGVQNETEVVHSSSLDKAKGIIDELQRQVKQLTYKLNAEEENRRKLEVEFASNDGEVRKLIGKEIDKVRTNIIQEAEARREGNEANDDKTKFFKSIIEEREKVMTNMLEDRIGRIENAVNMDADSRRKRIEEEQKETSKFLDNMMEVAKLETIALKKKHEAMTAKTTEHLRELSAEVVNIQSSTSKAEKRIGEITAASVQGVSVVVESGLKQHSGEIKELREVVSAEITARRSASDKLGLAISSLGEELRSDSASTNELMGVEIGKVHDRLDDIPSLIEKACKQCNEFALKNCETVKKTLEDSITKMEEKVYKLTNHVEEVQRESRDLIDHVAAHLEKTDKIVNKVQAEVGENASRVSDEILTARKNEEKLDNKIDQLIAAEKEERSASESELTEIREKKEALMMGLLKDDIKATQETAKSDTHMLKLECEQNLVKKFEEALAAARAHDTEIYSTVTSDIASSLTVGKSYADSVANEKNANISAHIEAVRSVLSEQVDGVRKGLQAETAARVGIAEKVESDILKERRKTDSEFTEVQIKLNEDAQFAEKERTALKQMIESRACKAEEKLGQRILAEAHTLRSLMKATFSEEVSDRMADVNDARATAEKLINSAKTALLEADARDKDFVLAKSAEWIDQEKAVRIEADRSNKNELDIKFAATAAREESRNVLRMIADRLGDQEIMDGHRELQYDIHKIRLNTTELKDKLVLETGHRIAGDKELNNSLLEEVETRRTEIERVDKAIDNEREERRDAVEVEMKERIKAIDSEELERKESIEKESRERKSGEEKEIEARTSECVRLDERIDSLWESENNLENKVDSVRNYVQVVENSAAKAIEKEVKERRAEDVSVREEEKCRNASENAMRFIIDKIHENIETDRMNSETARLDSKFTAVESRMNDEKSRVEDEFARLEQTFENETKRLDEMREAEGKRVDDELVKFKGEVEETNNKLRTTTEDNLRTATESMRMAGETEHREMVQLIADETGAVRKDVETMLGDIETAVKGAEGSVIKLDEKTEVSLVEIKKSVEEVSGKNEELKKETEVIRTELKKETEEIKTELKKDIDAAANNASGDDNKPLSKERQEEIKKIAKGAIEEDIKGVVDKVKNIPSGGIDWDALKNKAGVTEATKTAE